MIANTMRPSVTLDASLPATRCSRTYRILSFALTSSLAVVGCRAHSPTPTGNSPPKAFSPAALQPVKANTAVALATSSPTRDVRTTSPSSQPSAPACPTATPAPAPSQGHPCGPLDCRGFSSAEDAVNYVVRETSPLVLAVGEIHAQKGSGLAASPTQHFASLLPLFCGRASAIVIELWTARNDCGDNRVEQVRKAQKPVTSTQAATNQNDFLELGNVAKANHIQPHALVPTCDDYQSILAAKEQDIARMLELTATRTADVAEKLLEAKNIGEGLPRVILYGGAMHNDVSPHVGRESFSYGPRLAASTSNQMTELDIVLREQVRETESFRRMAWYPHYRSGTLERQFTLYRSGPRSFTLIFPSEARIP